ncbi:uncharacterized protein LOC108105943 [Drosophila eugracilis]|uniref:uncharacterized protein LOC108105943 n=1 Tax=Drosophila eugracilis TaxID=29029 RepID=UPI0007E79B59|nr:uncharacterized protein LOC108105943 [Drosophila eugracilis]
MFEININFDLSEMIRSEHKRIDDALDICDLITKDLNDCLSVVNAMSQKYNAPGRYIISMEPFTEDHPIFGDESTDIDATSIKSCDSELEMLSQLYGARSAQELDESYVDVRYKFIKLKRDFEATMIHCQRIVDHADRQEKITHRMLKNSRTMKKKLCRH